MRASLAGLLLLLAAAPVQAGRNHQTGGGAWLISDQGAVVATLPNEERDVFDVRNDLVYRLADDRLSATSIRTGRPVWKVACPGAAAPNGVILQAEGSRIVVFSKERIRGFDAKAGTQVYDVPTSGFQLRGKISYPWRPFPNAIGKTLYVVHAREKHLRGEHGVWQGSVAKEPPTARAIDVATGKTRFEFTTAFYNRSNLVGDIAPGIYVSRGRDSPIVRRSREQTAILFDPATGASAGGGGWIFDAVLGEARSYLLLDTTPPVLRAREPGKADPAWTTPGLPGAMRIVSVSAEHVVVDAGLHALVFDARTGTERARLKLPLDPNRRDPIQVFEAGGRLLLNLRSADGSPVMTALSTQTWKPLWERPPADVQHVGAERVVLITGKKRVVRAKDVTPKVWKEQGPALVVLDAATGLPTMRWRIPGPGHAVDSLHCRARPARGGIVVRMTWFGQ